MLHYLWLVVTSDLASRVTPRSGYCRGSELRHELNNERGAKCPISCGKSRNGRKRRAGLSVPAPSAVCKNYKGHYWDWKEIPVSSQPA